MEVVVGVVVLMVVKRTGESREIVIKNELYPRSFLKQSNECCLGRKKQAKSTGVDFENAARKKRQAIQQPHTASLSPSRHTTQTHTHRGGTQRTWAQGLSAQAWLWE